MKGDIADSAEAPHSFHPNKWSNHMVINKRLFVGTAGPGPFSFLPSA